MLVALPAARATEGGASLYLPGLAGDFGLGTLPESGWYLTNDLYYIQYDVERSVLSGRLTVDLDAEIWADLVLVNWVSDVELLGGRYAAGAFVPIGSLDIDVGLSRPAGTLSVEDSASGLMDIGIAPLAIGWKAGEFQWMWTETIVVPTGGYDEDNLANMGYNHWALDSSFAFNWLRAARGLEIAASAGMMINGTNDATDYQNGNEFHLDYVVNQYFSKTFGIGLVGYVYEQVTGDSGDGAVLGDFKGSSAGIGPSVIKIWVVGQRPLILKAKWLHDVSGDKRLTGDYALATLAFKL